MELDLLTLAGVSEIRGFQGEYRFLSNFYPSPVIYENHVYPTVEHAYQAAKSTEFYWIRVIRESGSPGKAKNYGKLLTQGGACRPDWEEVKVEIMYNLLLDKFQRNQDLQQKLVATGSAYLEETNEWNDTFWGVCRGKGQNVLGRLLMKVRSELNTDMPS